MKIINYIIINHDQCLAAFQLYQQVLGGQLSTTSHPSSADPNRLIHHAHLLSGSIDLMGIDRKLEYPYQASTSLSLYLILPSIEEAKAVMDKFGKQAKVLIPLTQDKLSDGYAYLEDCYGIFWHIAVHTGVRTLLPYIVPDKEPANQMLSFYKPIFSDEQEVIRLSDLESTLPQGASQIAKATLYLESEPTLIISDTTPHESEVILGSNMMLALLFRSAEEINQCYEALSQGAEIIHPLAAMGELRAYGMLCDKFGIFWELNLP